MTAFAAAIDDLFADPNLAVAVLYQPVGGEAKPVKALVRRPDQDVRFHDIAAHVATVLVEIRVSEVASPTEGDIITLDGETFIVQGTPSRDAERLVWRIDTRPAS